MVELRSNRQYYLSSSTFSFNEKRLKFIIIFCRNSETVELEFLRETYVLAERTLTKELGRISDNSSMFSTVQSGKTFQR